MEQNYLNAAKVYTEAEKRLAGLKRLEKSLTARLAKYPEGKLHIAATRKGRVMFYLRMDPSQKTGKYLSASEGQKIRMYAQKAYDRRLLVLVRNEIRSLETLLEKSGDIPKQIQNLYMEFPEKAQKLLKPADLPDREAARKWLEIQFEAKPVDTNVSDYLTMREEHVRSKSELNIANALYTSGIPYKYECPLTLAGGSIIHPDFTIFNVKQRKIMYWEHLGMMDDRNYARNAVARIKEYQRNRIFPGDALILTMETLTQPLGTTEIQAVIREYLM
ncbi:MAG: hypothetical protein PUE04_01930 [Lachnospira sp.]|nr:hypothetical protein [Lachnospira sp.]